MIGVAIERYALAHGCGVTAGSATDRVWDDGWTVVTADGLPSAQFEHTLIVTDVGCDVLTRPFPRAATGAAAVMTAAP